MVIWRTTARTRCALGARTLSSSPLVKAQAIDFSKAVEDFKTNGVAILPLKMEEEYIGKSRCFNLDWISCHFFLKENENRFGPLLKIRGYFLVGNSNMAQTASVQLCNLCQLRTNCWALFFYLNSCLQYSDCTMFVYCLFQ